MPFLVTAYVNNLLSATNRRGKLLTLIELFILSYCEIALANWVVFSPLLLVFIKTFILMFWI